jgi:hypothetical protein
MRSQPLWAEISRRRAEERFKSAKKVDLKEASEADSLRQAETAQTARLRARRKPSKAARRGSHFAIVATLTHFEATAVAGIILASPPPRAP